ncbi:TPA: hypothetical protein ENX78_15380 [Candidatus Poribacteria bacterium]|jgi:hypothetical protein|nr:hypothetical protein [Candidatus Poribacteria bacterium]
MDDEIISKKDIIAIVVGIALLLTGDPIATLYGGITQMVIANFQTASNTTMTNYVTPVQGYLPAIIEIHGIGILVYVAISVMRKLMRTQETV